MSELRKIAGVGRIASGRFGLHTEADAYFNLGLGACSRNRIFALLGQAPSSRNRVRGAAAPIPSGRFMTDEAGALKRLHNALGDDLGHDLVGVVDALAALVSKRIGELRGQVGRIGGRELVGVGHRRTIAEVRERSKNMSGAIVLVAMLLTGAASAQSPDISAQRLLSSWKGDDPMMSKLAEVIAAAFSSGLSW